MALDDLPIDEALKVLVGQCSTMYDDLVYEIDWYRNGETLLWAILNYTDSHVDMDEKGWRILYNATLYVEQQIEHIHNRTGEFA